MSTDILDSDSPAWAGQLVFDDPGTTFEERQKAIRLLLARRINSVSQPSLTLNLMHAAHVRCVEASKVLRHLLRRAPRILPVIRHALRDAFAMDPDLLLFTEPLAPQPARHMNSLIDRALGLFAHPFVPINLHHFTGLSVRGNPTCTLPYNAREALERVSGLGLAALLDRGEQDYWQALANGSWLSRRGRWVALRSSVFADHAFLAHQLYQLSQAGYAMVRQLIDAPTAQARQRAGGAWATLRVGEVLWSHATSGGLAIPGALHLYRDLWADSPQVVYLPSLRRQFHEFSSWRQLLAELPALINESLLGIAWQYLPLKRGAKAGAELLQPGRALSADALAHSANALLDQQRANEWGCVLSIDYMAPVAPGQASPNRHAARLLRFIEKNRKHLAGRTLFDDELEEVLAWDARRRRTQINFAGLSSDLALRTREEGVARYEKRLLTLLDAQDSTLQTQAYQAFLALEKKHQTHARAVTQWAHAEGGHLLHKAFWLERPDGQRKRASLLIWAQRQALRSEAQLERTLKLIKQSHLERLLEVLDKPLASERGNSDTRVLRVSVVGNDSRVLALASEGRQHTLYTLLGLFVVTTARAMVAPALGQPVVLVASGAQGGLAVFDSLDALSHGLRASLASRDGSGLWQCIGRDVREAARMAVAGLAPDEVLEVEYTVMAQDVMQEDFKALIEHYARLDKLIDDDVRLFSAISDPVVCHLQLIQELSEHLQVPVNEQRALAMVNVDFTRLMAGQAKKQPAWLVAATLLQRKRYQRLERRYLSSALALESRVGQLVPDFYAFARERLVKHLIQDGFKVAQGEQAASDELDIDKPLLSLPDDVTSYYDGWAAHSPPGDRQVRKVVSRERTTFSLLQLALHNLDPLAPWTVWRLNRARYLEPAWERRLSAQYLLKMVSSLDIAGTYLRLVQRAFYPLPSAPTGLSQALVQRATLHLTQLQVFSAALQGLSDPAQRLFNTVMAAHDPAGLVQNGVRAVLHFIRLRGYTLKHDRHITGVLVMVDQVSQRCLVYWPTASGFPVLSEYGSWQVAKDALNREGAAPENVKALSQLVAPGWEVEAMSSYPGCVPASKRAASRLTPIVNLPWAMPGLFVYSVGEAIARFIATFKIKHNVPVAEPRAVEAQIQEQIAAAPMDWLDFVSTTHCDAVALLSHGRVLEAQRQVHAYANSADTLAQYREQRLGMQWDATVRGLLSFVPVLGLGVGIYEVLLAARRYHQSGRGEEAVDVAFMTVMAFFEILSSFLPSPKSLIKGGTLVGAAVVRGSLRQLQRRLALAGKTVPRPPVATRPGKMLERFKQPFSRDGAIALKGRDEKGVYAKNGEQFFVDGESAYKVYQRSGEPFLRLKSPVGDTQGELVLHIRQERDWLLGADSAPPSPQPGPSSGRLQPFRSQGATHWVPPSWEALEQAMGQASIDPMRFRSWAITAPLTLTELLPEQRIFEVADTSARRYSVVHHEGLHYRVLPSGADVSPRKLMFVTRNQPLEHAASLDIAYWLEVGLFDQPIPATFGANGQWVFRRPLFRESLRVSLVRAFPSMTANSRTFLIARLLELSDPSHSLTATHLLRLRVTLDRWLLPNAVGRTDDLLRLLRPHHSTTRSSIFIGSERTTPAFERVDFTVHEMPHMSLRLVGRTNLNERSLAMQKEVRRVLEQQGFVVHDLYKTPGAAAWLDFSCTHPQSDNHYYVLTRWANSASIKLHSVNLMQMTDEWFELKLAKRGYDSAYIPIKRAMDEQRLVKIVAGIQWTPTAPPTVFFVRFGSLKPGKSMPPPPRQKRPHSPG
ncbi:hypothetical protein DYL59_13450 [Pseudomonas kairouanensis]|uniref:Dermonecrotic toxin N-terminal domain-containing protein n=1 Tax=Pseudomonas kairouanensis TaxID=2293832 RepID=A0A4Z0AQ29_9PSED|nr:DUF6543 domain-containing protein [Pseudomonas kairouanensis]TFY88902.1 hypothetical protein DYL59_13450 [Pseudomonas kairouanensis]